jgi:hypothetical protein
VRTGTRRRSGNGFPLADRGDRGQTSTRPTRRHVATPSSQRGHASGIRWRAKAVVAAIQVVRRSEASPTSMICGPAWSVSRVVAVLALSSPTSQLAELLVAASTPLVLVDVWPRVAAGLAAAPA